MAWLGSQRASGGLIESIKLTIEESDGQYMLIYVDTILFMCICIYVLGMAVLEPWLLYVGNFLEISL